MSDLWKCLNSSLSITSWENRDIFLGFIILSENYPELALIDTNKNQRRRRWRELFSAYSALSSCLLSWKCGALLAFSKEKEMSVAEDCTCPVKPTPIPLRSYRTTHSSRSCEGQYNSFEGVTLLPLPVGSGKGSASSKIVQFCCWPLGDFTLNVNRTSGRKMKNLIEIV